MRQTTKGSTTMTNAETGTLIFKNQAGEYFLLSLDALEQGRVPEERKAEVEQILAEAGDASGFNATLRLPDGGPDEATADVCGYAGWNSYPEQPTLAAVIAMNVAYLNGLYAGLQARGCGR
jgi:hypothetical protein